MKLTRSERWNYDTGFQRDVYACRIEYDDGRTVDGYLFDAPLLPHEFQRTAGYRVPILLEDGGYVRVVGYTWPHYVTRDAYSSVEAGHV